MAKNWSITKIRETKNNKLLVFVHGFTGDPHTTFGLMPAFAAGHPELVKWDICSIGYPTSLRLDFRGIWSGDPDLSSLSKKLRQDLDTEYPNRRLSFACHSMGGLVVQAALLEAGLRRRTDHLVLYGVPSGGLVKARRASLLPLRKRSVEDMAFRSGFINKLQSHRAVLEREVKIIRTIAGLSDEFVPRESSLSPFSEGLQLQVGGDHVTMVKPESPEQDSFLSLVVAIARGGKLDAPAMPTERLSRSRRIVQTAQTTEAYGRHEEAIELLNENLHLTPFMFGAKAGILKRKWIRTGSRKTAEEALSCYREGFGISTQREQWNAAGYLGINTAFMTLALRKNMAEARGLAEESLRLKQESAESDEWRSLIEAETRLHQGRTPAAFKLYLHNLSQHGPADRSRSIWQAVRIAQLRRDAEQARLLESLPSLVGAA